MKIRPIIILSMCAMMLVIDTAFALDYPTKPIKVIVPYTPGGSVDNTCRLITDQLQLQLIGDRGE